MNTRLVVLYTKVLVGILLTGCAGNSKLPIIGERSVGPAGDTIYHRISNYTLTTAQGTPLQPTAWHRPYIADFFFTTCPTICPVLGRNLLKVQAAFAQDSALRIVSHTVDPDHDTPKVLQAYAAALGADPKRWFFVTGDPQKIYTLIQQDYLLSANRDSTAPGGYMHSGALVLVDAHARIRGFYNGVDETEIARLVADYRQLLAAYP